MKNKVLKRLCALKSWTLASLTSEGPSCITVTAMINLLLNFASLIFTSRIYSPTLFGTLSVWTSISGFISAPAMLRFEATISVPTEQSEADQLLHLCFYLSALTSVIFGLVLIFAKAKIIETVGISVEPFLVLCPIYLFVTTFYSACSQMLLRKGSFRLIAISSTVGAISSITLKFSLISFRSVSNPLIIAEFVSICIALAYFFWRDRQLLNLFRTQLPMSQIAKLLKEYRQYPIDGLPSAWLDGFRREIPTIFVASEFGAASAGHFTRALQLVRLPAAVLGKAETAYLQSEASKQYRENGDCRDVLRSTFRKLAFQGVLVYGGMSLVLPFLVPIVFGPKWQIAGHLIPYISVFAFSAFVFSPLTLVLFFARKTRVDLIWGAITTILVALSLKVGSAFFGLNGSVLFYGIINSIMYVAIGIYIFRIASHKGGEHQ